MWNQRRPTTWSWLTRITPPLARAVSHHSESSREVQDLTHASSNKWDVATKIREIKERRVSARRSSSFHNKNKVRCGDMVMQHQHPRARQKAMMIFIICHHQVWNPLLQLKYKRRRRSHLMSLFLEPHSSRLLLPLLDTHQEAGEDRRSKCSMRNGRRFIV
jgi:hypothetical protein